jgi:hypothetical protein
VDHRGSGPPWTGLHCRPEELIGARPTGAPVHDGSPRLHEKDEELARVWFRAPPKTEERCGDRATAVKKLSRGRGGGGWRGASPFIVAEEGRCG